MIFVIKHTNLSTAYYPGFTTHFRFCVPHIRFLSVKHSTLPLDHRIFVCPLRLLPFPLDYNFRISSRLSIFMFSTSIHMFWTSRFICFRLLDSYVFDFDFYIFDFEFEIFDFEFEIFDFDYKNSRLRLKYYCSYFCPQRNAIRK